MKNIQTSEADNCRVQLYKMSRYCIPDCDKRIMLSSGREFLRRNVVFHYFVWNCFLSRQGCVIRIERRGRSWGDKLKSLAMSGLAYTRNKISNHLFEFNLSPFTQVINFCGEILAVRMVICKVAL